MNAPHGGRQFPTTHWSLVARGGLAATEAGREALGQLLVRYLPVLHAHLVHGRRLSADDADDVLQEFVASKVLENALVGRANAQLGKFRTFLLTALDRFLIDTIRQQSARKRSPTEGGLVALGDRAEEIRGEQPGDAFDLAWAHNVIAETLCLMRAECEDSRREDLWGVFEYRLLGPMLKGETPVPYDQLSERLGIASPAQASNLLITAKRMFSRLMRVVVGEYALGDEEIDAEIAELMRILGQA